MSKNGYQRLPGQGSSLGAYHRLYLGLDHLVVVESHGFQESYRRLFFADIQALTLRRTLQGWIINVILGTSVLVCLMIAGFNPGVATEMMIPGGLFLLILLVNSLLGPTCRCHIQTPVQNLRIRSLHRLRVARKVFKRVQPLVEAAQTHLVGRDDLTSVSLDGDPAPSQSKLEEPPTA